MVVLVVVVSAAPNDRAGPAQRSSEHEGGSGILFGRRLTLNDRASPAQRSSEQMGLAGPWLVVVVCLETLEFFMGTKPVRPRRVPGGGVSWGAGKPPI